MKILFLPNWKVEYCKEVPENKQPPDYYLENSKYWFFRYFPENENIDVDVVDISSLKFIENIERNKLKFYVIQTLKILPKISQYDIILSHGMQSGILLSLIRKIFKIKTPKHIVFDIGAFNSAKESGIMLKLMQFASKSIDGIIYHTMSQRNYYEKYYPWIIKKSKFISFGTDSEYFKPIKNESKNEKYIICVGYSKRDWNTLIEAYSKVETDMKLKLIGKGDILVNDSRIEVIPFIPIKQLMNEISNCRFSVLPLDYYNYSYGQMTLLQQMSMGKCVVAAKVPSLEHYIDDGINGFFYESKNSDDLALKISRLINNEILCEKVGKYANQSIIETFSEKNMAYEIYKYIKNI